ncbi:MAG: RidA family protein [Oscillospiraceae bacterium]|nr:RidA family protein [Oscillospiraceae bacterium]MDE6839374.1 RidA family protein [Oscillospiraceae bacterium]
MDIYERMTELGIELPPAPPPVGLFLPARQVGSLLFASGQGSFYKDHRIEGKVGADVTLEDARLGARYCMLNMLASLDAHLGDLNRILRVVKLLAFVSSAPDFCRQPDVVNGASQLLIDLWGEEGRHARSAIAVNTLPSNLSVEIEAIFELDTSRLSEKPLERKGSVCL